jgi:hypothetical protein
LLNKGQDTYFSGHNSLDDDEVRIFKNRARMRHETFNGRLKHFDILGLPFRHTEMRQHKAAFEAVAVIVQYQMENGYPLFVV